MKRSSILLLSSVVMLFVLLSASKCNNKPAKSAKEEAIELYEKGLNFDKAGMYKDALLYYSLAIEKDSLKVNAFTNRGGVKEILGDTIGAIDDYLSAIRIDSLNVIALNNIGCLYSQMLHSEKAEYYYLKAMAVDSSYANTYYNYALTLFENRQEQCAIKYFQRVGSLERAMEERYRKEGLYNYMMDDYYTMRAFSYYFLGLCYKRMGNMEKAVDYLRLAEEENVTGATDSLKTITQK
ncbi:tetratricopeptide repeat protein [Porphyromonas macacae]|nr:tetratricopeptide repeat protein [Porphyromonas macacae]